MTRLLVSVRDSAEAAAALAGGADIIDVKEPRNGSLGRAEQPAIDSIAACVASAGRPCSVALGELREYLPDSVSTRSQQLGMPELRLPESVQFAKLGLACAPLSLWREHLADFWNARPPHLQPVAVAYADHESAAAPSPWEVLDAARDIGASAVLIDTYDKRAGNLLHCLAEDAVRALIDATRAAGMHSVIAGSLTAPLAARVASWGADIVAVRGAVCRAGRTGRCREELVRELSQTLLAQAAADQVSNAE